jgi:Major tropism determinant N-terminal domain
MIVQISQLQVRRGLNQDLPQLAPGELAWSVDTRQLYIGNGTLAEGSPAAGTTEVMTQFSILNFTNSLSSNISALASNVTTLQNQVSVLQTTLPPTLSNTFAPSSSGVFFGTTANNLVISYTLSQGTPMRTGTLTMSYSSVSGTATLLEEYAETATTDVVFSSVANFTYGNIQYSTTTGTTIVYTARSF